VMKRQHLKQELYRQFGGTKQERTAVARMAMDLVDSGHLRDDLGSQPTVSQLCGHLSDAPDAYSLTERWNWWIGSLEIAFGGYLDFRLREDMQ